MPANSSLFKPCPEYRTKSSLFKPSVTQPISQTPYDLNNELLVRYSGHGLNNELLVRYSGHGLNNEPFGNRTILDHLNNELVRYSDPHCTTIFVLTSMLHSFDILAATALAACVLKLSMV